MLFPNYEVDAEMKKEEANEKKVFVIFPRVFYTYFVTVQCRLEVFFLFHDRIVLFFFVKYT